jgi:hypothetical protein
MPQLRSVSGRSIFDGAAATLSVAEYLHCCGMPRFLLNLDFFQDYNCISIPWLDRVVGSMGWCSATAAPGWCSATAAPGWCSATAAPGWYSATAAPGSLRMFYAAHLIAGHDGGIFYSSGRPPATFVVFIIYVELFLVHLEAPAGRPFHTLMTRKRSL